jgi:hypothetical protein
LLRSRILEFRESVLKMPSEPSEHHRAAVRSSGVNLFVSVEQFVENLLVYNMWLMGSDHYTQTAFCFAITDARHSVEKHLGSTLQSGGEIFNWKTDGTNALGTLLAYLQAYREWIKGRTSAERKPIERLKDDYPHYAKDTILVFPFRHTEFWADASPDILQKYIESIDAIYVQLLQAELTSIRNGIDHKRSDDEFPRADKMLACVTRLQQAIDTADARKLIPKLFWGVRTEQDSDGNICDTFRDYRGQFTELCDPAPISGVPGRGFGLPHLIAPYEFLNQPNSTIVFRLSPKTEYRDYWREYPRRRVIPSNPQVVSEDPQ